MTDLLEPRCIPEWSRRSPRAVPAIPVPAASTVAPHTLEIGRIHRATLLGSPLLGVAAFAAIALTGWWLLTPVWFWFHYGVTSAAVHHLIHASLGLSPAARHRWLTGLGLLILESGHAWQTTHLLHHCDGTDLPDPEGFIEGISWRRVPGAALIWRFRMLAWGWHRSPNHRRTAGEIIAVAVATLLAVALIPWTLIPAVFVALMQFGTFTFAALRAKGPHTGFGKATLLTMVDSKLIGAVLFHHHLHLEHHAYPKVPLAKLAELRPHVRAALADQHIHHQGLPAMRLSSAPPLPTGVAPAH